MSQDHQRSKAPTLSIVLEDARLADSLREFPGVAIYCCADLIANSPQCDAVVVTNEDKHLNPNAISQLAQFNLAVLAVVDEFDLDSVNRLLHRGVHHVLLRNQATETLLTSILSVVSQHQATSRLQKELASAEQQWSERDAIDQARTIIAKRLDVSGEDALCHLRTEARNRRRRLAEVAELVVEASSILTDISTVSNRNGY